MGTWESLTVWHWPWADSSSMWYCEYWGDQHLNLQHLHPVRSLHLHMMIFAPLTSFTNSLGSTISGLLPLRCQIQIGPSLSIIFLNASCNSFTMNRLYPLMLRSIWKMTIVAQPIDETKSFQIRVEPIYLTRVELISLPKSSFNAMHTKR